MKTNNESTSAWPRAVSSVRRLALVGLAALVGAGWMIAADAHQPPQHPDHHRPHGARPDTVRPATPYYPEIGIDVRPDLEHWPSNYRPDGYRLPGYDGRPAGHHACRGAHGTTLSSAGTDCPPDQKPEKAGRHLSTGGS